MPETPIGVMASDEEAYKSFNDLFGPIIKDLHPKFDFRYSYKFEDLSLTPFEKRLTSIGETACQMNNLKI